MFWFSVILPLLISFGTCEANEELNQLDDFSSLARMVLNENKEMKSVITQLVKITARLELENIKQKEAIVNLEQDIKGAKSIKSHELLCDGNLLMPSDKTTPDIRAFSAYACNFDTITLSCTGGKNISITSAYYAQYAEACSGDCCAPHPDDCSELMEDYAPLHWDELLATCNDTTTCQFTNPGATVPSCADPYVSDYAIVYYTCLPEDTTEPIAFSAFPTVSRSYGVGDVVMFDGIITNVGDYYDPVISTFICAHTGLYVFSVSVWGYNFDDFSVALTLDDDLMIYALSVPVFNEGYIENSQGGITTVLQCNKGSRVWVQCGLSGPLYGHDTSRYSSFTGFLLKTL